MTKFLITIATSSIIIFSGCSDSYDKALEDTSIDDIVQEVEEVAKDKNVILSESTQDKIENLETNLTTNPIVSSSVLDSVMDIISDVKETITNSTLSTAEKEEAINQIEAIERDKLQEGLTKYTEEIQQAESSNTTNCSTNNTGSLPPMIPSDECLNK